MGSIPKLKVRVIHGIQTISYLEYFVNELANDTKSDHDLCHVFSDNFYFEK